MKRPLALAAALLAAFDGSAGWPVFASYDEMARAAVTQLPPVRAVTRGPAAHWFGYYDKFQLDPAGRRLLAGRIDFEHRLPRDGETIALGYVDLADGDRWVPLGTSAAWSWQQGCMLQWRPGSTREVVWNDREGDRFVGRVLDVETGTRRTLPLAIEHISPDGRWAACADFRRIAGIRPGYGYAGLPDPFAGQPAPAGLGVWRMDLDTGAVTQLVTLAEVAARAAEAPAGVTHYVNHLAWAPDGKRLLFFHRWTGPGQPTRVWTVAADGRDLRLLVARGGSHWAWRDSTSAAVWAEGAYRLYADDGSGQPQAVLWTAPNGHHTYLPGTGGRWLVTDTYPQGPRREQIVYLVEPAGGRYVLLGRFPSTYTGEWRCDTHPRVSRDGAWVFLDSPHGGQGRQQYAIDLRPLRAALHMEEKFQ